MTPIATPPIYTTGQIAKLATVSPRTVCKWVDSGRLHGYRLPGSQDRRVPRDALVRFLKENGMPMPCCFVEQVLLAGVSPVLADAIRAAFPEALFSGSLMELAFAVNPHAGAHTIVMDASLGRQDTLAAGKSLRTRFPRSHIIGLACADEPVERMTLTWVEYGFNAVLGACGVESLVKIMRGA